MKKSKIQIQDIVSLPYVYLNNKKNLPKTSGVYFAVSPCGEIQYIGQSRNINQRWVNHERIEQLKQDSLIYWLDLKEENLVEIEKKLINEFKPSLNNSPIVSSETKKKRMSLYLSPSVKADLKKLARINNRSMSNTIEIIILNAITKYKDKQTNS